VSFTRPGICCHQSLVGLSLRVLTSSWHCGCTAATPASCRSPGMRLLGCGASQSTKFHHLLLPDMVDFMGTWPPESGSSAGASSFESPPPHGLAARPLPAGFGLELQPQALPPRHQPLPPAHVTGQDHTGQSCCNQCSGKCASTATATEGGSSA
jgi:hypothetical protein